MAGMRTEGCISSNIPSIWFLILDRGEIPSKLEQTGPFSQSARQTELQLLALNCTLGRAWLARLLTGEASTPLSIVN